MKRIYSFLFALLLAYVFMSEAAAQQHISFEGISFDQTAASFCQTLADRYGFVQDEEDTTFFWGQIYGDDVVAVIDATPKTGRMVNIYISSTTPYKKDNASELADISHKVLDHLQTAYNCELQTDESDNSAYLFHAYAFLSNEQDETYGYIAFNLAYDEESDECRWEVFVTDELNEQLSKEEGAE